MDFWLCTTCTKLNQQLCFSVSVVLSGTCLFCLLQHCKNLTKCRMVGHISPPHSSHLLPYRWEVSVNMQGCFQQKEQEPDVSSALWLLRIWQQGTATLLYRKYFSYSKNLQFRMQLWQHLRMPNKERFLGKEFGH